MHSLQLNVEINAALALTRSRDSAVGIVTGYGQDERGVGVLVEVESRIFFSRSSNRL
jgi:hypothetical protein